MLANIHYYDINGDTKRIGVEVKDTYALMAAINAIAAGGNFIQEVSA